MPVSGVVPKIELHVHLEGTIRARTLLAIARRNRFPLPSLVGAGVGCSISTDDPAMFGTDLGQGYELLPRMGVDPRQVCQAAARSALCDEGTRRKITAMGEQAAWPGL
jgi:adenosine deaminase